MSKYKFDISKNVRDAVEWELRYFRENMRQLEEYKMDLIHITQSISPAKVAHHDTQRDTESAVLRMASSAYIRRLEWVCDGISRALKRMDETDIKLIELYYWRNEYTIEGAGAKIGLSRASTFRHVNRILGAIAFELGYIKD